MGWILFFDGDCALCSRSVRMVARLDKRGNVSFAPLQGELAREMGFSNKGETMVLLREVDGMVFMYGDAWIELTQALGGGWRVFSITRIIPRSLRDFVYRFIARHRHRIMVKTDHCALSDEFLRNRLRK